MMMSSTASIPSSLDFLPQCFCHSHPGGRGKKEQVSGNKTFEVSCFKGGENDWFWVFLITACGSGLNGVKARGAWCFKNWVVGVSLP